MYSFMKSLFRDTGIKPPHTEKEDSWVDGFFASPPHRYFQNLARYRARNGRNNPESYSEVFAKDAPLNAVDVTRLYMFSLVLDQIDKERVTGNVAELGVFRGNTAAVLARYCRERGLSLDLFDTFEGFDLEDLVGFDGHISKDFSNTSLNDVQALVGLEAVNYYVGRFPESLNQVAEGQSYALVHIDCDLYAPMKSGLEYFYPRLEAGGFLILHDYNSLHWDGAERAIDEFFSSKPESVTPVPDAGGTVLVRKARSPEIQENWYSAAKFEKAAIDWVKPDQFPDFLLSGWSFSEDWGIWGIGAAHFRGRFRLGAG